MTRLQKALEKAARARLDESSGGADPLSPHHSANDQGTLGITAFAEATERGDDPLEAGRWPMTQGAPAFSQSVASGAAGDPIKVAKVRAITCPQCGSLYEGSPRGPQMKWCLGLIGMSPYRCKNCRRGFEATETTPLEDGETSSIFLRPEDERTFQEVISDVARDERQQNAQHAFGPNVSVTDRRSRR
jgi:hypothetical protein